MKCKIKDPLGMHARPSGKFVQLTKGFESSITLFYNGKRGDGKSIIDLMRLCIRGGDEFLLRIEGEDEELASAKIEEFFNG